MAKIAALGAYLYQAALAFGLLILVSNLLPSAEYTAYSLFISITQFASIICFEWIKVACSRFYPGPNAASEAAERGAITREFLACSVLCCLGAVVALGLGVPVSVALLGLAAAVIQGGSEIHLTVLRFRQDFRLFSWMQGMRATILAVGTCIGAAVARDFAHVLAGLMAGYGVYTAAAFAVSRRRSGPLAGWDVAVTRRHLVYGSVAASASIVAMLAPLGLKAILTATLGPGAAAGPMLALDLLQRPFTLIVSSLQAIRFPELVAQFDRKGDPKAIQTELGRYYALLVGLSLIGAAGIIALLGLAAQLVIPVELREAFLRTAPFVMLMAMLRALAQTVLPTPAHLQRRLTIILALAALDCVLTCAGALAATWFFAGTDTEIIAGAAAGAAVALALGFYVLRGESFAMPWLPIALSAAALALSWLSAVWFAGDLLPATGVALATALIFSAYPLFTIFRWIAR